MPRRDRGGGFLLTADARGAFRGVLVLCLLLNATTTIAQSRVHVRVAGAETPDRLAHEVGQLLSDLDVGVDVTVIERIRIEDVVASQPRSLLATTWIRLDPDSGTLYLADPLRERVLVREVDTGGPEVVREQLLQILRASLEALLIGQTVGDPRQHVEASLRSAPAHRAATPTRTGAAHPSIGLEPREGTHGPTASVQDNSDEQMSNADSAVDSDTSSEFAWWFAGALGYNGRRLGRDAWTHGPLLALEVGAVFDGWILAGYVQGQYRVPISIAGDPLGVELQGGAVEVGARIRHQFDLWEVGLGVGPIVEWLSAEGSPTNDSGLRATVSSPQTLVAIVTEGLVGLRVTPHFAIEVRAGVETELKGAIFAYRESGTERAVFSPDVLRARASMGVRLHW